MTDSLAPVWVRQGTILSATAAWEQGNLEEPRVLYRVSGCQILSSPCFGMWYTGGGFTGAPAIGYAESADGKTNWTKYTSNPIIVNHWRGNIYHEGSTLYEFVENYSTSNMDLYTSPDTDGIIWTLAVSSIISHGSTGQFDQDAVENSSIINDNGVYEMMYEGRKGAGGYSCGLATATAITGPWTKTTTNPLITGPGCSGPFLQNIGGVYWLWAGVAIPSPSEAFGRWTAPAITGPWTQNPDSTTFYGGATFSRSSSDEAPSPGGIGDQYQIEVNGQTYRYYSATNNEFNSGSPTGNAHIKLAIASYPLATLVTSIEGMTSQTP